MLMLQVHAGTCGPHMNDVLLAKKIMLQGYFWSTMEADCCQFVCRCHSCQYHGVDVDFWGVYEDECGSTCVVNFVVIATYQWVDKAPGELMMMWVVGSLDRR